MPRVHIRKARKDYPANGIQKGDTYYYTKLRLQRGGITKRSKTPFRPSQLTNSPFKSGFLSAQEAWEDDKTPDAETIRAAAEAIRELAEAANESYENMPEGLQEGETGQLLYERGDQCESKADELDGLADEYEALEEPENPGEFENEDLPGEDDKYDERLADHEELVDAYETELAEYESEKERIVSEAADLIGDMPE